MHEELIWGDGFVDDDWRELTRVREWSRVSTDELVRLFPGLVPAGGGRASAAIVAFLTEQATAIDADLNANRPNRPTGWAASAADAEFLRRAASPDSPRDVTASDMARFAYLTGVHPAYVWPQAATLAEWGAAAAWLGALSRRGAAFLPEEVAEYFADVASVNADGDVTLRDPLIADLARRCVDPVELLRAVRRRREGVAAVVRRRSPDQPDSRVFAAFRRSLRRLLSAHEATAAVGTPAP
jgi:hypothetical protein